MSCPEHASNCCAEWCKTCQRGDIDDQHVDGAFALVDELAEKRPWIEVPEKYERGVTETTCFFCGCLADLGGVHGDDCMWLRATLIKAARHL